MADESVKQDKKPMDTGEKVLCAAMLIIVVVFSALGLFGLYAGIVKVTTPETLKTITIKNAYKPYGESSTVYIEDMDCKMYATYSPSVAMNIKIGATRDVMVKLYDRFYLWFEPIENRYPEITADITKC